jgi:hypothetical protein
VVADNAQGTTGLLKDSWRIPCGPSVGVEGLGASVARCYSSNRYEACCIYHARRLQPLGLPIALRDGVA